MKHAPLKSFSQLHIGPFHIAEILALLVFCVFISVSTFFALNLKRDVIPDEGVHISLSSYFATTWAVPPDIPATYRYGSIQHKPYLYYWINARLQNLIDLVLPDPGSWKTLVAFRLANVFYAALAVFFSYLLAAELGLNAWWRLLAVFMLANTLMFVFLSGGVNYDNLANLCSFAGIYHLLRVINRRPFLRNSIACLAWLLIGTLVKFTVLPLLAILAVIWLVWVIRNRAALEIGPVAGWRSLGLLGLLCVLLVLNFLIYGVNLIQYRALLPSCTLVLTESQCAENPVFVRDRDVYLADKLSIVDMFNGNVPDPLVWLDQYWSGAMLKMIFGAIGHRSVGPSDLMVTLLRLWIGWILLVAIRFWKKPAAPPGILLIIVLAYSLVLLQTNLSSELNTGFKHLGIQGRYIFPVIGGFYILIAYLLARIPNRMVAGLTLLSTLALFVLNSPLWILTVPAPVQFPSGNLKPEEHTIRISDDRQVSQDFRSECLGALTQVDVLFSAGSPAGAYPVNFELVDLTDQVVVARQIVRETPIAEQTWLSFPLASLQGTNEHAYRILLKTSGGDPHAYLWLWNTRTNVYRGGDAVVGGVPTNTDIIFRYTCRMPLLADWFN